MAEVEPYLDDFGEQRSVPGDLPHRHSKFEERVQRHYRIRRKDIPAGDHKIEQEDNYSAGSGRKLSLSAKCRLLNCSEREVEEPLVGHFFP